MDTFIITAEQSQFDEMRAGRNIWFTGGFPHKRKGQVKFVALVENGRITQWASVARIGTLWNPDEAEIALKGVPQRLKTPIKAGNIVKSVSRKRFTTKEKLLNATTFDDL